MSQIWDTSYSVPVTLTWFAVGAVGVSLVIRRRTWHAPGEVAATTAVLLLGLATYLSSDECNVGELLWHATGYGYLDNFAGQLCYVAGTLALLSQVLYRVADDVERAEILDALVRQPVTLLVPSMISAMYMSTDLHDEPLAFDVMSHGSGAWALVYRSLYLGAMLYLTLLLVHVLLTVRRTGGGGVITNLYLLACGLSLTCSALRVADMLTPGQLLDEIPVVLRASFTIAVAATAALSWVLKMRGYRRLLRQTRTTRRQLRSDTIESHRQRVHARPLTSAGVCGEQQLDDEPDGDQLTPASPHF
ncbi:hypothetical protein FGG44_gp46 [Mycobacterium phage MacnCheese]|uniref:Uncharacterized protein n=1 Tax=Mycobacterium phage MacnCheese TaxID=2927982 RepID=I6XHX7_9CAUD|nr:hypothetical protein FGG44_gp46 [Mycobacterium phage MacnCheese]AFN37789.1 hypothetical protein MACNCHEESE_46 [Mycobacterium phage MacnCheese]